MLAVTIDTIASSFESRLLHDPGRGLIGWSDFSQKLGRASFKCYLQQITECCRGSASPSRRRGDFVAHFDPTILRNGLEPTTPHDLRVAIVHDEKCR